MTAGVEGSSPLREAHRRLLLALVEPVLGPVGSDEGPESYLHAVADLLARMRPRDRRQAFLLLHFLQLSPLLFLEGRNFTGLDPARRHRHLSRLAGSRLTVFRRAATVIKTMVAFAWYGRESAWDAIGYGGPWLGRIEVEKLPDPDLGNRAC